MPRSRAAQAAFGRHDAIQYTAEALQNDITRLQRSWRGYQKSRRRNAVYRFLNEVLQVATLWRRDGHLAARCRTALTLSGRETQREIEPFRTLIVVAARSTQIQDRTLSKWSRV